MKWSSWSSELPPKVHYAKLSEPEREILIQFGMHEVRAEFQLYKSTKNGAHMWRSYQLWRRLMPDDLALPREMVKYLDKCAEAVAATTKPAQLKNALQLNKQWEEHGGGRSGATAANASRQQVNAMQYVRSELFKARVKHYPATPPRGYKAQIYEMAAKRFGFGLDRLNDLMRRWRVAAMVDRDMTQWCDRRNVR